MFQRFLIAAVLAISCLPAAPPVAGNLPKPAEEALDRVSPNSLKGHVSFLASDLLEGRNTPSRGLDIAAEYIAAQFRRAGLQPLPEGSYFQIANWKLRRMPVDKVELSVSHGDRTLEFHSNQLTVNRLQSVDLSAAPIVKAEYAPDSEPPPNVEGSVVITAVSTQGLPRAQRVSVLRWLAQIRAKKPAILINLRRDYIGNPSASEMLVDPDVQRRQARMSPHDLIIHSPELVEVFESLPVGLTAAKLSLKLPATEETDVALRNVIGVLPGSDPLLKDTYVLVTAHYDHVGTGTPENGDRIYNGANDDASGTSAVLEIASVLASGSDRPKRSIVFIALFGEEKGLLGARYYARNPAFPLDKTVANLNLEHLGRSDSTEGPQTARLSPTGYDYSTLTDILKLAGQSTGVEIYHHAANSDAFFNRSDNAAFAEAGIPSTTVCAVFEFSDYHGAGDHWDKLDYDNFAKVTRTALAAAWIAADSETPPVWNELSKTESYRKAQRNKAAE